METGARFVMSLVLVGLAMAVWPGQKAWAGPPGVDLDAIIFADDFDAFTPAPFDPCLAYIHTEGPPARDDYDPCIVVMAPDLTHEDTGWSNKGGADFIFVADGQYVDPDNPDPCNHALCVYKQASSQGLWEVGYAYRDITSVIDAASKTGDRLLVSFDVFMPYTSDSWDPRGFQVAVRSRTNVDIVILAAFGYTEAGSHWLRTPLTSFGWNSGDEVIPGPKWDAPAWNHYELYIHFGMSYVDVYIGEETTARYRQPIPDIYSLADVEGIGFGSVIFYWANRIHGAYYDNISVSTNFICPGGDITGDCAVGPVDLAVLASEWLTEGEPLP